MTFGYNLELRVDVAHLHVGCNTFQYSSARWRAHPVVVEESQVDVVNAARARIKPESILICSGLLPKSSKSTW